MSIPTSYQGFDAHIGLEITAISADEVRGELSVRPELLQPYGLLHGGVLTSVVETLGSVAGATWYGDRGIVVGMTNHTHFLRPVREGRLEAVATPVHRGRTSQLWLVEVRDEQQKLVARGELRVANLPQEP